MFREPAKHTATPPNPAGRRTGGWVNPCLALLPAPHAQPPAEPPSAGAAHRVCLLLFKQTETVSCATGHFQELLDAGAGSARPGGRGSCELGLCCNVKQQPEQTHFCHSMSRDGALTLSPKYLEHQLVTEMER